MASGKPQTNGADPYGSNLPPDQRGGVFHRATAFLMSDTHTQYLLHSGVRNSFRAVVVAGVFAAVIICTAFKYSTDNSLKSATETQREENVRSLSGPKIEVSLCPCRNETFPYSAFVTYKAPLSSNFTEQVLLCQNTIVPQLATTPQPGANASSQEITAYIGYLSVLSANVGVQLGCSLAVQDLLAALDPNPANHVIGFGNNFYSTELLSEPQLRLRLDTLIGTLYNQYQKGFQGQLGLQQLILNQLQTNLSSVASTLQDSNSTAAIDAFTAASLSFDVYTNITADTLTTMQNTASDMNFVNRLLDTLKNASTVNYDKYIDACAPYYCDITQRKTAWGRVVEFLGLIGGLYTTFLGVGFTAWFLLVRPDADFNPLARYESQLRALPLAVGALGIVGTLLNRILSGVAPVVDASSAQSRGDVLLIGMSAVLVLTGLQWLALAPKEVATVQPSGQRLDWTSPQLSAAAAEEIRWAYAALSGATRCCGLVAFWDGKAIAHLGAAAGGLQEGAAVAGDLVQGAVSAQRGNYLANLTLYPGRFEFFQYLPSDVQGVALAPLGDRGCLVAAVNAVRGFSRADQAWLSTLADKIDSTLEEQ